MLPPPWLPKKINTNGIWERVLSRLYKVFDNDFKTNKCYYDSCKIVFDTRKIDNPYEEGFWHLISKINHDTNQREPDFPRAQKLPWCKPVVENHQDSLIKCWQFEESNYRIRTYIWLVNFDYVVIIEKRKKDAYLVTAFHVSGDSSRKNLNNKYDQRIAKWF